MRDLCELLVEEYFDLVHRQFPSLGRAAPVGGDVAKRQPDEFAGGGVAGEVAPCLDDLRSRLCTLSMALVT